MNNMASTVLSEESVEKKLMSVMNTQDSIQSLSLWIIHHKTHYAYIVELWYKVMKNSEKPSHRLTLLYLCNDVVQTCKRKKAPVFVNAFKQLLLEAVALVRDATIRPKVERIFNIWEERQVFDKDFVKDLRAILEGDQADAVFKKPFSPVPKERLKDSTKKKSEKVKEDVESTSTSSLPSVDEESADGTKISEKEEVEKDDVPSEEILAAFKPIDLIAKMQSYRKQASEVENSAKKLSHLKLDASSIEAIKHLKDRAHGNEFSNDFEESCLRLEETAEGLEKLRQEQTQLMAHMHIAEHFYNQQHSEARIVVNAYKNYGGRISQVKKKLDELIKNLASPVASPSPEADTPESTPPHEQYEPTPLEYCPEGAEDGLNGDGRMSPSELSEDSISGTGGLENRLSSFLPSLQSLDSSVSSIPQVEEEEERPIPVYIPQPIHSNGNSSGRRPSANHMLTDADDPFLDEEGDSTPLTDEPPTTPVMDEDSESSPSPPPPPPPPLPVEKRKENPIDFLSRLISQSQKNGPQISTGTSSSFLANFSRLTSQLKEKGLRHLEKEEEEAGDSPRPKCWAEWKAEKAVELATRVVEPPNTSVPPPLIPGLMGPISSLAPIGLPPPPLPVLSLPLIPPPAPLAPLSQPPRPALPVVSVPPPTSLPPLIIRPPVSPMSGPSLSSPSSLVPVVVPPPLMGNQAIPSLSSSSPLAPQGMHPLPLVAIPPMSSPTPMHVSPIKSMIVPHPQPPSPISPQVVPVVSAHPVPSSSLTMPSSPYYEHTSPGQKENWPEVGEGLEDGEDMMNSPGVDYPGAQVDMPFPPVSMRMRGNNSVLKELTPSMDDPLASETISSPPPASASDSKAPMEEVSAISTLASSPSRGGPSFMDKLKQKHPRGYLPSTYTPNPNLMTLTQGEEEDMDDDDDDDDDDDEEEEDEEEEEEEKKEGATRIPVLSSVVRRVDPREKWHRMRQEERHRVRVSKYSYPSSSSRRDRRYSRENSNDSFSASSSYRDRRSYDYNDTVHVSEYSPYSDDPYDDKGYVAYPSYGLSSGNKQKHGVSRGSSHRSYRH